MISAADNDETISIRIDQQRQTFPDDQVQLRGLVISLTCGVSDAERGQTQKIEFDLDLFGDLSAAGNSDDVSDTTDYGAVAELLKIQLPTRQYLLLESIASTVEKLLFKETSVNAVTVVVRKLSPPVAELQSAAVKIHRKRPTQIAADLS